MTSALIISGGGDYTDPWHPYLETSRRIAGVLETAGCTTLIETRVADADFHDADLLVINAWNNDRAAEGDSALRAGIEAHVGAEKPLLVMHCALLLFSAPPESAWAGWEEITGAVWERGVAMHPPLDDARVRVASDRHPIVAGIHDFSVEDERYTDLRIREDVVPLAWHEHDGTEHPLLWTRAVRDARVVVDLLGHDTRSYDSPHRRELLARSGAWLLGELP